MTKNTGPLASLADKLHTQVPLRVQVQVTPLNFDVRRSNQLVHIPQAGQRALHRALLQRKHVRKPSPQQLAHDQRQLVQRCERRRCLPRRRSARNVPGKHLQRHARGSGNQLGRATKGTRRHSTNARRCTNTSAAHEPQHTFTRSWLLQHLQRITMPSTPNFIAKMTEARLQHRNGFPHERIRRHRQAHLPGHLNDARDQQPKHRNAHIVVHIDLRKLPIDDHFDLLVLHGAPDAANKTRHLLRQLPPKRLPCQVVAHTHAQRRRRHQPLLAMPRTHMHQHTLPLNTRILKDDREKRLPGSLHRSSYLGPVLQPLNCEPETRCVSGSRNGHAQRVRPDGDRQRELLAHAPHNYQVELQHALQQPPFEKLLLLHHIDPPRPRMHVDTRLPQAGTKFSLGLLPIETPV